MNTLQKTVMAFGVSASLAMAMSMSASAQQGTQTNRSASGSYESKETTLTGCVTPNRSGGYFLTQASMSSSSMSDMNRTGDTRPGTTTGNTPSTGSSGTNPTGTPGATGTTGSTNTPGTTGSPTTPGTTGTTATAGRSPSGQQMMSANTYNLENGRDMQQYVNKKVEVVGHVENTTSGDQMKSTPSTSSTGTTGSTSNTAGSNRNNEIQARDFDVKSIRMVASSC